MITFVLLMEGLNINGTDLRIGSRRYETGQCNCLHVYIRIRTSVLPTERLEALEEGASPYDMQLPERY